MHRATADPNLQLLKDRMKDELMPCEFGKGQAMDFAEVALLVDLNTPPRARGVSGPTVELVRSGSWRLFN